MPSYLTKSSQHLKRIYSNIVDNLHYKYAQLPHLGVYGDYIVCWLIICVINSTILLMYF